MRNFEKKFGKYAIHNLPMIMIGAYVAGYLCNLFSLGATLLYYCTLNPAAILQGQIWRLVTWILIPPTGLTSSSSAFDWILTLIMLYFYYSIGTMMERTWGAYRFNVYIFGGMFFTILAAFACYGVEYALNGWMASLYMAAGSYLFTTYYINMSVFLAFALTYPEARVLLMMVIPVKVKWLGILYCGLLVYEMFEGFFGADVSTLTISFSLFYTFVIGASLLNFLIFFIQTKRGRVHLNRAQKQRRAAFRQQVNDTAQMQPRLHKCSVCGQTDAGNPNLVFRYCSKCAGVHEYCQEHLFSHEHIQA